jgi:hypothetical protein
MTSSRSPSTVEVAATAAQAVRELTHRTLSLPALRGPAELDRLVAELAVMTDTLPQLLRQLSGWLGTQQHAGRLRSDNHTDPRALVDRATADLTNAEHAARQLSQALDNAHQHTAHLSASSAATPSPPPADHARPPTPTGQESWPPAGSFMATSGQVFCPQVGRNRCPLTMGPHEVLRGAAKKARSCAAHESRVPPANLRGATKKS